MNSAKAECGRGFGCGCGYECCAVVFAILATAFLLPMLTIW